MEYRVIDRGTGEAVDPSELAKRWAASGEPDRWSELFAGELPDLAIVAVDETPSFAPGSQVMLTQEALEEYGAKYGGQAFLITGRGVSSETGKTIYYLEGFEEWVTGDEIYHP